MGIRKTHSGQNVWNGMPLKDEKDEEGQPEAPQISITSFMILPSDSPIFLHGGPDKRELFLSCLCKDLHTSTGIIGIMAYIGSKGSVLVCLDCYT